ncbi:hypothetical protein BpHYR1_005615 [Brachionus plicatilis]|uniref:Uncharacterized protein n=1 Tax=Brachionus plicatilis TaxID=10195 RepID=A0A3M7P7Y6_BRAPC|nr:hypothetical protein BpHYR1_005615 [Brachionus plicatilis]
MPLTSLNVTYIPSSKPCLCSSKVVTIPCGSLVIHEIIALNGCSPSTSTTSNFSPKSQNICPNIPRVSATMNLMSFS